MSDFDWDEAIDKARTKWEKGFVHQFGGGECAIGILASVSGMTVDDHTTTSAAVNFVVRRYPEVIQSLHQVLAEQEPTNKMDAVKFDMTADEDPIAIKAHELVSWNDAFCPGGETLASYMEKAKNL